MPLGFFGKYISNLEDENYPTWPCLNKKNDESICEKILSPVLDTISFY